MTWVRTKTMPHSTFISKICMFSIGYLSTTTVTPSVATTSSEITGQFFTLRVCFRVDAQNTLPPIRDGWCMILRAVCQLCQTNLLVRRWTYTIYRVYDIFVTQSWCWHKSMPRMSFAHELRNYFIITAVTRETTHAEDHAMRTDLTNLYYILTFIKRNISRVLTRDIYSLI